MTTPPERDSPLNLLLSKNSRAQLPKNSKLVELNPHLEGSTISPKTGDAPVVGDGGRSWKLKLERRAKEREREEARGEVRSLSPVRRQRGEEKEWQGFNQKFANRGRGSNRNRSQNQSRNRNKDQDSDSDPDLDRPHSKNSIMSGLSDQDLLQLYAKNIQPADEEQKLENEIRETRETREIFADEEIFLDDDIPAAAESESDGNRSIADSIRAQLQGHGAVQHPHRHLQHQVSDSREISQELERDVEEVVDPDSLRGMFARAKRGEKEEYDKLFAKKVINNPNFRFKTVDDFLQFLVANFGFGPCD